jgi:hypothetical protein
VRAQPATTCKLVCDTDSLFPPPIFLLSACPSLPSRLSCGLRPCHLSMQVVARQDLGLKSVSRSPLQQEAAKTSRQAAVQQPLQMTRYMLNLNHPSCSINRPSRFYQAPTSMHLCYFGEDNASPLSFVSRYPRIPMDSRFF